MNYNKAVYMCVDLIALINGLNVNEMETSSENKMCSTLIVIMVNVISHLLCSCLMLSGTCCDLG